MTIQQGIILSFNIEVITSSSKYSNLIINDFLYLKYEDLYASRDQAHFYMI